MKNRYYMVVLLLAASLLLSVTAVRAADDTTTIGNNPTVPPPDGPTRTSPVLVITFFDSIPMHNMAIASDGTFYYTGNGGNAASGQVNTYDLNGVFLHSASVAVDIRALFYNSATGHLYAKSFDQNLYQVDPVTGAVTLIHSGIFAWSQSSPALVPDGTTIIEHEDNTIRLIDFNTGQQTGTMTGFYYGGFPSNEAVGTSGDRIFTWDGTLVHVYDMAGNPIESYNLPSGHYGFSLKFVNGLLFASDDGGGGTGVWYGYDVGAPTPTEYSSWGRIKQLFR